jgi:transposase
LKRRAVPEARCAGGAVRWPAQHGPLDRQGTRLSEQRKYRSWTTQQKIEIVLAGVRGDRSVREVCREHAISETLYYGWREELLEGGREAFAGKEECQGERELRRKVAELERALGRKTYELEITGKL